MVLSISINSDRFGCTGDMVEFRRPQTALLRRFSRRNHVEIQKALHTPRLCTHNTNKKINEKQRKQGHTSIDCLIARQNYCTKIESYETVTWWVKILVPDEGEGCSSCFWKRDQGPNLSFLIHRGGERPRVCLSNILCVHDPGWCWAQASNLWWLDGQVVRFNLAHDLSDPNDTLTD